MSENYGLKISKPEYSAPSANLETLEFSSGHSTYMLVKKLVVKVVSAPATFSHGLGYIPKIFVYKVGTTYNQKLPIDDSGGTLSFSVGKDDITITGGTGTFCVLIFNQEVI